MLISSVSLLGSTSLTILNLPNVVGLSLATRPDAITDECIELLKEEQIIMDLKYYGIDDLSTGIKVKQLLDGRDVITAKYIRNNINTIDDYINYILLNVIMEFKEVIPHVKEEKREEYDIDFNNKIPFEYFDCDENYGTMYSFAEYYEKLLKNFDIEFDNLIVKEKSDGKYEMNLNNTIIDIRAWDKIESVIDNVNTLLELNKDKEIDNYY